MAESTLSITYADLRLAVANYLGMGLTVGSWSVNDAAVIEMILKSGLRQFYFPPSVGNQPPYEWSFMKPVTTMATIAPYDTGTIAVVITGTTVTLTTGTWPSWAATHGSLVVDGTEYVIASRTSDSGIELESAWTESTETAAEYVLKHDGNYDLPDDFAAMEGDLIIESENYQPPISLIGEGRIRSMRQMNPQNQSVTTSTPIYAAIRPKVHTTTTTGQRFEIMFFPLPSRVLTISYVKVLLPQMLVTTTLEYPYGGAKHAETLRAAVIAAAEEQQNGNRLNGKPAYDKKKLFEERLAASIQMDKMTNSIKYFGYNGDNSDALHRPTRQHVRGNNTGLVTYDS